MSTQLYQEAMKMNIQGNPIQMLYQLMNNPVQFILQKRGFNIPQNIANNPTAIIQYMMNNGYSSQGEYNNAVSALQNANNNINNNGFM